MGETITSVHYHTSTKPPDSQLIICEPKSESPHLLDLVREAHRVLITPPA